MISFFLILMAWSCMHSLFKKSRSKEFIIHLFIHLSIDWLRHNKKVKQHDMGLCFNSFFLVWIHQRYSKPWEARCEPNRTISIEKKSFTKKWWNFLLLQKCLSGIFCIWIGSVFATNIATLARQSIEKAFWIQIKKP